MNVLPFKKPSLGDWGEKIAVNYLMKQGYQILDRNYKTKLGELDIVAKEGDIIVFVEVKTRSSRSFGLPQEAVNFKKQNKIMRMAMQYLQNRDLKDTWRIDVVGIVMSKNRRVENIDLIRNAVIR